MIFFVVPNGFQFPYIPVYNDQRGERIAAGNGEDVDEGFLGHRHTDGIARVVQQRVVFPVTGNPHVIHKQGDVLGKRIRQHGRAVHRGSLLQVRAARRHKVFFREYGLPEQCTPACTRAVVKA